MPTASWGQMSEKQRGWFPLLGQTREPPVASGHGQASGQDEV